MCIFYGSNFIVARGMVILNKERKWKGLTRDKIA